ncbi:MAG TPA: tetratricopeptide repeat protein [Polyangium sp.]|nr:tetratricopeptide repeat protein [Polyangium sp.]
MKNNPAFLDRDELIRGFVVRQADLKLLTERLHEHNDGPCQHMLVIAPRGMGKTTLVLRVVADVQLDKALATKWYPIVFSEESYEVATAAELWLEALGHLGRQTQDFRWQNAYRDLKSERDEQRLYDRALGRLMDFADEQKKKLLIVVENLNMILHEQLSDDAGWILRHTLQNEPRIMLLATATSRFDEIDNADKAMYDLFFSFKLEPLNKDECRTVWHAITGHELTGDRIRPVEILTGGSPRLLAILGSFAAEMSLRELMRNLAHLVDEHTSYFKSNLESLPVAERKIYVTLADIWSPATAREVAESARIDINKASASLHRLMDKGAVAEISKEGRTIRYQVTERLYNIYHLLRKHRDQESRVRWFVEFMIGLYEQDDIIDPVRTIVDEACATDPDVRRDHFLVYGSILKRLGDDVRAKKILAVTNPQFFQMDDAPDFIKELPKKIAADNQHDPHRAEIKRLMSIASAQGKAGQHDESAAAARKVLELDAQNGWACSFLVMAATAQGRHDEAAEFIATLEALEPRHWIWERIIGLAHEHAGRHEKALLAYERALDQVPNNDALWVEYGIISSKVEDWVSAEKAYKNAITCNQNNADAWSYLSGAQGQLEKLSDAESSARQGLQYCPHDYRLWRNLAISLLMQKQFTDECEEALRRSLGAEVEDNVNVFSSVLRLHINRVQNAAAARAAAERYAHFESGGHVFLASLAMLVMQRGWTSLFPKAESWARNATEKDPTVGYFHITLAVVLAMRNQWTEAFDVAQKALRNQTDSGFQQQMLQIFFMLAAATDHIAESLTILSASPAARELEPLVVALQILNGQNPNAPYEILEVAKDIVKQVDAIRAKVGASTPSTAPKASAPKRKAKHKTK